MSAPKLLPRFEEFIKERQYLSNVSPATIHRYRYAFCWLDTENPTSATLKAVTIKMRDQGLSATSVNSHLRCIASYLHWNSPTGQEKCGPGCQHLRVPKLKEERRAMQTFSEDQVKTLLNWKPKTVSQYRLSTMVAFLFDTGARCDEMLSVKWDDIDFDNLLVLLHGKGRKDRKIPISLELRKRLFLFQRKIEKKDKKATGLVFSTRGGTKQGRRNVLRDVKNLCRKLGFEPPARTIHATRHSFALHYIRKSGSPFLLQRALGHTTLTMTQKYVALTTEDLSKIHQQVSLLA
jgi:integrase/recombinase XerD